MKRDEMEALVQNAVSEMRISASGKIAVLHLPPKEFGKLFELAALGASVAAPTEEEIEAMARALQDAEKTPYVCRRNKAYDDGRIFEIIRQDNPDWRDVITDDQTVIARYPNEKEAVAHWHKLEATFRARAAILALKDRANV